MVILTPTLSGLLVTVRVETLADITLTGPTHRVAPPVGWTGLLGLPLTVLSRQERRVTLAPVPDLLLRVLGAGGVPLAGVEVTHVVAGVSDVSRVTLTGDGAPALVTPGVGGADLAGGEAGVGLVAPGRHAVLQLGAHIGLGVGPKSNILK